MPEGLLNLNAAMIMITCFLFAHLSSKLRAVSSMTLGTLLTALAFALIGWTNAAWVCLFGIVIFSTGEMLSSPKMLEFIGNMAPPDKKAMYLGFSQLPLAVGWVLEGYFGPLLYGRLAAKETLSRNWLQDNGMSADQLQAIPQGEAFSYLTEFAGQAPQALTEMLYQANSVGFVWDLMALIALASAIGLFFYGRWILALARVRGPAAPQPAGG